MSRDMRPIARRHLLAIAVVATSGAMIATAVWASPASRPDAREITASIAERTQGGVLSLPPEVERRIGDAGSGVSHLYRDGRESVDVGMYPSAAGEVCLLARHRDGPEKEDWVVGTACDNVDVFLSRGISLELASRSGKFSFYLLPEHVEDLTGAGFETRGASGQLYEDAKPNSPASDIEYTISQEGPKFTFRELTDLEGGY